MPDPDKSKAAGSRKESSGQGVKKKDAKPPKVKKTFLGIVREWTDAIIIAYILAMFIRTFVVELFKIPTGSMTPTLVGDYVAEVDYDGNGQKDLLVANSLPSGPVARYQVFLKKEDAWEYRGEQTIPTIEISSLSARETVGPIQQISRAILGWHGPLHKRNDKIFVNKFAYWFSSPERGDLIVFKVPENIWSPERPIYIKRAVAFGGETVSFINDGHCTEDKGRLAIDGEVVKEPPVFNALCYAWSIRGGIEGGQPAENRYEYDNHGLRFVESKVPKDSLLALGDNTDSSSDGRYWGSVPVVNLKGKAFFRYSPLSKIGFLH